MNKLRGLACFLVFLAALALRLRGIDSVPWHPDEGDTAEVGACIAQGRSLAVGAMRQTAFFPLSVSPLAPLAAAGLIRTGWWQPLPALRRWSAFLGALGAALLCWILWGLVKPSWGILAGVTLAAHPLAAALQQMGFYHHLGAALSIACLALLHRYAAHPSRSSAFIFGLFCGLAVATAYWLLWLLLLPPLLALLIRRPKDMLASVPALALPLALVALWSYSVDAPGFWADIAELGSQAGGAAVAGSAFVRPFLGFYRASKEYPGLAAGLAGLCCWIWLERRQGPLSAAPLTLLWAFACSAEAFRQRQNLEAFSYPLILVLAPMACGLTAILVLSWNRLWQGTLQHRLLPLALSVATLWSLRAPVTLHFIRLSSAPAIETSALINELKSRLAPGDLVLGEPAYNWALVGSGIRASDLEQAAITEGERGSFLRADSSSRRFVFTPKLEDARLLVLGPFSYGISFHQPGPRRLGLRAEMQGWTKIWTNGIYDVYGNPAKGFPMAKNSAALLRYYDIYDQAALDAVERRDWQAARWALTMAGSSGQGDVAGRALLLKRIQSEKSL